MLGVDQRLLGHTDVCTCFFCTATCAGRKLTMGRRVLLLLLLLLLGLVLLLLLLLLVASRLLL
jgi:hypothetical protein